MNNIYYLGPKDSYSHNIAKKVFGASEHIACNNFGNVVKNTLNQKDSIGVLPIENSITSNIHENMDYLFKENLMIIAEAYLKIRLYLVGFKNAAIENIKKVYSHAAALSQCKGYIQSHNFTIQETASTASAKNLILKINDKRIAAIGSKELTDDPKLKILDGDIGDVKFNITRFAFVSKNENTPGVADSQVLLEVEKQKNKASLMFTLTNQPGTLAKMLTEFSKVKLNLVKIDSRPIPATRWEYQFWVDIENDKEIKQNPLSDILKKNSQSYKIIGIYPSGKIYE